MNGRRKYYEKLRNWENRAKRDNLNFELFCQICGWTATVIVLLTASAGVVALVSHAKSSHKFVGSEWKILSLIGVAGIGASLTAASNLWPRRKMLERIVARSASKKVDSDIFAVFYSNLTASRLNLLSVVSGIISFTSLVSHDYNSFFFGFSFIALAQTFSLITTFRSSRGFLGGSAREASELIEHLERSRHTKGGPPFTGVSSKYREGFVIRDPKSDYIIEGSG